MATTRSKRRSPNTNTADKTPPPSSYKWGWCTGLEEDKAHDACPGAREVTFESANYNVGDIAKCGCECHAEPKKKVRKSTTTKTSASR